ncbi:MAG: hypothetical protein ACMXYL_05580 [Candidatus Woesearchaeota archaeon]
MEQEEIMRLAEEDVKRILSVFGKQLEEYKEDDQIFLERDETIREPNTIENPGFKERMLKNAPKHDGSSIIAEKKHW